MDITTATYVVAGHTLKGGDKLQFLGFDSHSGGYPWASSYIQDKTSDIMQAISWLGDAKSDFVKISNPKVYEVILREVDISAILNEEQKIDQFLNGISATQKEMLKRKLK